MAHGTELKIRLRLKPNPYYAEPGAHLEVWGSLLLSVVGKGQSIDLVDLEWDLYSLAEWFIENRLPLCQERLSIMGKEAVILPGESLAQACWRLRDRDFAEDEKYMEDQWFDDLLAYWGRHTLDEGLPGMKLPAIIIGCNSHVGEISAAFERDIWSYNLDMHEFCESFAAELRAFLKEWSKAAQHIDTKQRANSLLARLEDSIQRYPLPARCCE